MKIGGFIEQINLTLYSITSLKDKPGSAGDVLDMFAEAGINIQYITEGSCQNDYAVISLCIDTDDSAKADKILKQNVESAAKNIKKKDFVTIIGIYGPHFREKPGIVATFCKLLGEANINILGISTSISTISCVIELRDAEKAKNAILKKFELP